MIDEPNAHNHQQHLEGPEADRSLPPEVEALAARLTADGAVWQSRLPDPVRVAERIRAIAHDSLFAATTGDSLMFDDTDSAVERRRSVLQQPSRPASLRQRLSSLAAVAAVLILVGGMATTFFAVRTAHGGNGGHGASSGPPPTSTTASAPVALQVTSVVMSVSPASIAGMACGTQVTITYTAHFTMTPNSSGGTVQFNDTVNNGRGQRQDSITFRAGETTKDFAFTWSGALPADHTYPAPGGVQVTSPNPLTSALVAPTGRCTSAAAPVCGANFSGAGSQPYQATLTTTYGTVPLPPHSRIVPNDASGGVRGFDICSAGAASDVTAYMEQNLPAYGWTLVSRSSGVETWRSNTGTINWSVPDPLQWNINWRVPLA